MRFFANSTGKNMLLSLASIQAKTEKEVCLELTTNGKKMLMGESLCLDSLKNRKISGEKFSFGTSLFSLVSQGMKWGWGGDNALWKFLLSFTTKISK